MFPSWLQIAIVILLIVLLFGRGRISDVMGDIAKGIKSFKKGMADDESEEKKPEPKTIDHVEAREKADTSASVDEKQKEKV